MIGVTQEKFEIKFALRRQISLLNYSGLRDAAVLRK
jgi:hypothetical protein